MEQVTERAYGKINLALDVTGIREDGYHLVRMIMQTVELHDTLELEKRTDEKLVLTSGSSEIPLDGNNLVCRAIEVMRSAFGIREGVSVTLDKQIPVAAGMAGGSSDAAAAMRGMRKLFRLSCSNEELRRLALPLGVDIPYCIEGGTVLAEGIGEILTAVGTPPACGIALIKPPVSVMTGEVYRGLDRTEKVCHPDIDGMLDALRKKDLTEICGKYGNVLAQVTEKIHPVIRELEQLLEQEGAVLGGMTGSGPTVFGIFRDQEQAQRFAAFFQDQEQYGTCRCIVTSFIDPDYGK